MKPASKKSPVVENHDRETKRILWVCLVLFFVTLFFYRPIFSADFINYDDSDYVVENPHVQKGLCGETAAWAFTSRHSYNWHPVTWLSHALDCQLFGVNPKWHHGTSVFLHAVNTVLLFLVLRRMTKTFWRSAIVAALFALHPLHVESVAWVSERKDLLSAFFGFIALWFYVRFAERKLATFNYLLALIFFALSLMSKPMLVTFPFILLLLDFWPLQRIQNPEFKILDVTKLILEKIPFFIFSLIECFVAVWAQGESVATVDVLPLGTRLANVLVSYLRYVEKIFVPINLAIPYPYEMHWPIWKVIVAILFLTGTTAAVVWPIRRRPYLAFGWFWFLGTLVPVIGLVQVGQQAMADRFTYLPAIGLFIAVIWGAAEWLGKIPAGKSMAVCASVVLLGALATATSLQVRHWQNSVTLFSHSAKVTANNSQANNFLGDALYAEKMAAEALACFQEAVRINPNYAEAHNNLGTVLMEQNRPDEALEHFAKAVALKPGHALSQHNFGLALLNREKTDDAIVHFQAALAVSPNAADTHYFLGNAFRKKENLAEAKREYAAALALAPAYAEAHRNLGNIFYLENNFAGASAHFREVVRLKPGNVASLKMLADSLARAGKTDEAAQFYAEAIQLAPTDSELQEGLAKVLKNANPR